MPVSTPVRPSSRMSNTSPTSTSSSVNRRKRELEFENRKRMLELEAEERRTKAEAEEEAEAQVRRIRTEQKLADLRAQKELQEMRTQLEMANLEEEQYCEWQDPDSASSLDERMTSWLNQAGNQASERSPPLNRKEPSPARIIQAANPKATTAIQTDVKSSSSSSEASVPGNSPPSGPRTPPRSPTPPAEFQEAMTTIAQQQQQQTQQQIDIMKAVVEMQKKQMEPRVKERLRDLPSFNGSPEEWPVFVADYRQSTELHKVHNVDNRNRLQKALKGKALDAVRSLLIHPDNVERIITTLETCFGRPKHIIKSLIHDVSQMKKVKEDDPELFVEFSNAVQNVVITIEHLKKPEFLQNTQLLEDLESKLSPSLKLFWAETKIQQDTEGGVKEFADWLEMKARLFISISNPTPGEFKRQGREKKPERRQNQKVFTTSEEEKEITTKKDACAYCGKTGHAIDKCRSFGRKTRDDRWNSVKEKKLCFRCLKGNHRVLECKSEISCGQDGCSSSHHRLLHSTTPHSKRKNSEVQETSAHVNHQSNRILLKVLPVTLKGPAGSMQTFALLDGGSSVTLVAEEVAKKIGATGPRENLKLSWINADSQDMPSSRVNLIIQGKGEPTAYKLQNVRPYET